LLKVSSIIILALFVNSLVLGIELGLVHHFGSPTVMKDKGQRIEDIQKISPVVSWVREGLYWLDEDVSRQPVQGFVEEYLEKNLNILGLFAYSHPTQTEGRFYFHEAMIADFGRAFGAMARKYPEIRYWEILNEMNLTQYFRYSDKVKPWGLYQKLLREVSSQRPEGTLLVSGGLTFEGEVEAWLKALCSKQSYDDYDVLALHPYSYPKLLSEAKMAGGRTFAEWILWILQEFRNNGLEPKPIWITEIGWPHGTDLSEEQKAWGWVETSDIPKISADAIGEAKRLGVEVMIFYALEDDEPQNRQGHHLPFGFYRHGGEKKLLPAQALNIRETLFK